MRPGPSFFGVGCPVPHTCLAIGSTFTPEGRLGAAIYRTIDGGRAWTNVDQRDSGELRAIDCPSTSTCFTVGSNAAGGQMVLITDDGGKTWTRQDAPGLSAIVDIDCPTETACYAAGAVVAVTTDGAATWRVLDTGRHGRFDVFPHAIACPSEQVCLLLARTADFQSLIRARGSSTAGAAYTREDTPGVGTFRYWLEAVGAGGEAQVVGAAEVWVGVGRAFLPRVVRGAW